jgi:excisionase family DNA binding protein
VAARLAVSERFVRRLVFERRIPFLKIGHFIRFEADEVEQWIEAQRVSTGVDRAAL